MKYYKGITCLQSFWEKSKMEKMLSVEIHLIIAILCLKILCEQQ